ncbi:MAG: tetratricopeptide repeat protein [Kiloniellales bacterium]|nr:tetratricopeptide repeat protein [Kiloniellales bacterium]
MPILGAVVIAFQILLVVHVLKTGRQTYWVFIVMMLPLVGAIAYFFVEILPELAHSRAGRQVAKDLDSVVNPDRELRQLTREAARADTVENRFKLAKECLYKNRYEEAQELLAGCLQGIHGEDPAILLALAKARFGLQDFAGSVEALDRLRQADPNFQSAEGHLLYARGLEGQGETEQALYEYEALVGYFAGEEARCRYGLLLEQAGRRDEAREVFAEVVRSVELAPKPYYRAQREWYEIARERLGA